MVIRRDEAPLVFFAEAFFGCLSTTLLGVAGFVSLGMPVLPVAVATPLFWLASEALVVAAKGWGSKWFWRYSLAAICRECLLVAWWLRTWFSRKVTWGGTALGSAPRKLTRTGR